MLTNCPPAIKRTRPAVNALMLLLVFVMNLIPLSAQDEPAPLYALPNAFNNPVSASTTMTITQRGRLIVANPISDTVSVLDPLNRRLDAEIPVGEEPHHVALTPDNERILVTNRLSGTLSIITTSDFQPIAEYFVGSSPYGVVASPDGATAYVARFASADVVRIDLATGIILQTIPTPADPVGLALWGEFLYVTHLWQGQVSLIYRPANQVIQTLRLHPQASHAHTLTIDARNGLAYVPYTLANTQASFPDQALLPRIGVIDLARFRVLPGRTIDLITADRWLNLPHALTFDPTNNVLFIVSSASNALTIMRRNQTTAQAHIATESAPRAVIAGRDGVTVYVHNAIAQTVSLYETRFNTLVDTIPTSTITDPTRSLALRAFYTVRSPLTPACSACHADGWRDDRIWNERPTPSLRGNALADVTQLAPHPLAFGDALGALPDDPIEASALVAYLRELASRPPLIQD